MNIEADAPLEGTPLIRPSTTDHPLYDAVVEACRTVYDPEIPVNIYDLGLVYTIEITPENDVNVAMTLTAPAARSPPRCPAGSPTRSRRSPASATSTSSWSGSRSGAWT